MPEPLLPEHRSANILLFQLSNGYWGCELSATIPGHPAQPYRAAGDSFHNARECIEWASLQLENATMVAGHA